MSNSLDPSDRNRRRTSALNRPLLCSGLGLSLLFAFVFWFFLNGGRPGDSTRQIAAVVGSSCLVVPLLFSLLKRSEFIVDSPKIFELHVLFSLIGFPLIMWHAAPGEWFTPPGFVLLLVAALLVQGVVLRGWLSVLYSRLFAREPTVLLTGFFTDREAIARVIAAKRALLSEFDSSASEAVFSLTLRHWLRSPLYSLRYQVLYYREARLMGIQRRVGWLAWARSLHLLFAALFYLGLLAHIVVVLFFAGYAAGDDAVYWWHVTSWGRTQ